MTTREMQCSRSLSSARFRAAILALALCSSAAFAQKAPEPDADKGGDTVALGGGRTIRVYPLPLRGGDFEKGKPGPAYWGRPDGLTTFWDQRPGGGGRCMRFDSNVYKEDVFAREKQLAEHPESPALPKSAFKNKYDAIAATYGARLWSAYYRVEKGADYVLTADVMSADPVVFLWVKGYILHRGQMRVVYKIRKECKKRDGSWYTYTLRMSPTKKVRNVQFLRVQIVALWPPGEACVDNVQLRRLTGDIDAGTRPADLPALGGVPVRVRNATGKPAFLEMPDAGVILDCSAPVSRHRVPPGVRTLDAWVGGKTWSDVFAGEHGLRYEILLDEDTVRVSTLMDAHAQEQDLSTKVREQRVKRTIEALEKSIGELDELRARLVQRMDEVRKAGGEPHDVQKTLLVNVEDRLAVARADLEAAREKAEDQSANTLSKPVSGPLASFSGPLIGAFAPGIPARFKNARPGEPASERKKKTNSQDPAGQEENHGGTPHAGDGDFLIPRQSRPEPHRFSRAAPAVVAHC